MDQKKLQSRRATLRQGLAVVAASSVLGVAVKAQAQSAKAAPASVAYQDKPSSGNQCSGCVQFVAPASCKIVDGVISPSGWCELWSPKAA